MAFTVVPLQGLNLPKGSTIPFGTTFTIRDVPEWLRRDERCLGDLNRDERIVTLDATQALVSEYYVDGYGYPDPQWSGDGQQGIQKLRFQSAILANMSIWLIQPTPIRFSVGFHALTQLEGRELDFPIINATPREPPLWCHPRDESNPFLHKHLSRAATLFGALSMVPRKNDVWAALRAFWAALSSYVPDHRYPLFWQGLESLFGNDDDRGVSRRLRDRISYFLADAVPTQQELCEKIKLCYRVRSEIVHGRWEDNPDIDDHMYTTEGIVRTVMRRLADNPAMLQTFHSSKRDQFLESWVQSKALLPPQLP